MLIDRKISCLALLWLLAGWPVLAAGEEPVAARPPQPTEAQVRFFENRVRPLLANRCFQCHGPEKQKGSLRLDTRAGLLAGGDLGPAIEPGEPEQSRLLTAIRYDDEALRMPPNGKLPEQELADLTAWIKAGAFFPAGDAPALPVQGAANNAAGADAVWAFQPLTEAAPPVVENSAWVRTPLDQFVLAGLEASGLEPAPAADKRTLIRRVTFDLLGLPPTPDEVAAFLTDESPQAFATVVERLLASPHYGERWGRHWLDVVRYADSNGLDENVAFGNAWRYRDYVVAALNADKPYDEFLLEQLAGDLLPATDDLAQKHARLIATGFLALGPKVLAEVDETKMELDIIDEQVDTFGRAVLGLTLGCARCHDHKFDPISTEDYYALAGIFKSTRTMEHFKKIGRWYENELPTPADLAAKAAHEQTVAAKKAVIQSAVEQANAALQASRPGTPLPQNPEGLYPEATKAELKRLRDELAAVEKAKPVMPSAMGAAEGTLADLPVHIRGNHLTLGKVVPRGFPQVLTAARLTAASSAPPIAAGHSGRLELAQWLVAREHPLTSRVLVNRVWRWHFGEGLVRSPDNFGKLGERPTHPRLLDWLALRFREHGWSLKALHRLIMLSSTYQMSSGDNARAAELDPTNRLLWRVDLRRLEAEEIHDALLAVSGRLDRTLGGSLLHVPNRGYLFDHTSTDNTKYDSPRRALYLPVIRNHLYDVFQLFDTPDGSVLNGDRESTTVAPQALFMLNSELVAESSERLAELVLRETGDDAGALQARRLDVLYQRAYGRPPSATEAARDAALLERLAQAATETADASQRHRQAWTWLCQTVLAANEFIYVK